jgi:hypothetical protein
MVKKRYAWRVLVGKPEEWRPLGRRKVINWRIDLKNEYGNTSAGLTTL